MPDFIEIGYTQKTHGVKGELKMFVEEDYLDILHEKKRVFLEIRGSKVPYFINHIRGAFEDIVLFEDVPNREAALLLQSRKIFLPDTDIPADLELSDEGLEYAELEGYMLTDKEHGPIGTIEAVLEMPQQEMALLHYKEREILIPLNEHFIVRIDDEKKEVLMDLPEGILIY